MNIRVFYFTLWPFILHLAIASDIISKEESAEDVDQQNTETFKPLYLLNYKQYHQTTFVDMDVFEKQPFSSVHKPSEVVILCPDEARDGKFRILKSAEFETLDTTEKFTCGRDFKPSFKQSQYYEMGYRIHAEYDALKRENDFLQRLTADERLFDYWASFLELDYDRHLTRTEFVRHSVFANLHSDDYTAECDDRDFGKDILGDVDIEKYYTQAYQESLFKASGMYGYLVMHQLAPIRDDINNVIRSGLCSYLNTVPLWRRVSEYSVRRVEELVRKVADVIGYIKVTTGAPVSESTTTMDSSRMPVPRVIIKTLVYTVDITIRERITYIINVFIHNERTDRIKRKFCPVNLCDRYGWTFDIDGDFMGNTYCCLQHNPNYPPQLRAHHGLPLGVRPFDLRRHYMKLKNDRYKIVNVVEILNMPESERENAILQSPDAPAPSIGSD